MGPLMGPELERDDQIQHFKVYDFKITVIEVKNGGGVHFLIPDTSKASK